MGCCAGKPKKAEDDGPSKEIRTIFAEFDSNGNGLISRTEFENAMKRLDMKPTPFELNAMFVAADSNRDGKINCIEFEKLIKSSPALSSLQRAFHEFDPDSDGCISEEEMRHVIANLGQNLTNAEIRTMFKRADLNGDGKIDFEEFAHMMRRHPLILNLREIFRQFDIDNDGFISFDELRVVGEKLSVGTSEADVKIMFQNADKNADDKISFEEFASILTKRNK